MKKKQEGEESMIRIRKTKEWDERYRELSKELKETNHEDYRRYRRIHKELKKYGCGVWWYARYPQAQKWSVWISGIALAMSLLPYIICIIAYIITHTTV